MPVIKISLNDLYYEQLKESAQEQGISIQDYIRKQIFKEKVVFSPVEAVEKALSKYTSGDLFTLPELYGEEWTIKQGAAGVFGKQFNNYISQYYDDRIVYVGKTNYDRHAQYKIL